MSDFGGLRKHEKALIFFSVFFLRSSIGGVAYVTIFNSSTTWAASHIPSSGGPHENSLAWQALPTLPGPLAYSFLYLSGSFYFIFSKASLNKDGEMSGTVNRLWLVMRWIISRPWYNPKWSTRCLKQKRMTLTWSSFLEFVVVFMCNVLYIYINELSKTKIWTSKKPRGDPVRLTGL